MERRRSILVGVRKINMSRAATADTGPQFEFLIQHRELPWLVREQKANELRLKIQPTQIGYHWMNLWASNQPVVVSYAAPPSLSMQSDVALAVTWCLGRFVNEGEPIARSLRYDMTQRLQAIGRSSDGRGAPICSETVW